MTQELESSTSNRRPGGSQAILLAGGRGTRLRPFAASFPKPLVPLGDRPVLEILIRRLRDRGFDRIILCVGHLAPLIQAYFQDGSRFGVSIEYSLEPGPLGTAGPLAILHDLDSEFLVCNGDLLTDLDFMALMDAHRQSESLVTVARYTLDHEVSLGVLEVDESGALRGYVEKPVMRYDVSMGAYAFRRAAVERFLTPGERADLPDLVRRMLAAGERIETWLHPGQWIDIGRPDDYARAQDLFEADPAAFMGPDSNSP